MTRDLAPGWGQVMWCFLPSPSKRPVPRRGARVQHEPHALFKQSSGRGRPLMGGGFRSGQGVVHQLYQLPGVYMTDDHRGSEQQKPILPVMETRRLRSSVSGLSSLQRLQERVLSAFSSFWRLQASLRLWPHPSSICLHLQVPSPLSVLFRLL